MLRRWLVALLVAVPACNCAPSSPRPSERVAAALAPAPATVTGDVDDFVAHLEQRIPALLELHGAAGTAVALIDDGELVATRGFGRAGPEQPITPDTVFVVGSISKTATAWGVAHLLQRKGLSLDDPALPHLRSWTLPGSAAYVDEISFRRLLDHTAGVSTRSLPQLPLDEPAPELGAFLSELDVRVQTPPGSETRYSGGGYGVLQLVIEDLAEDSFAATMQREMFEPLAMSHSSFAQDRGTIDRRATPYTIGTLAWRPERYPAAAAQGLSTTVADMARLVLAKIGEPQPERALGWEVGEMRDGAKLLWMAGGNPGWRAYLLALPEDADAIILLANATTASEVHLTIGCEWLAWKGHPRHPDMCKAQIHGILALEALERGAAGVEGALAALRADPQARYVTDQKQLALATELLVYADRVPLAFEICELANKLAPGSPACFTRLARIAEDLERWDTAERAVLRAEAIAPDHPGPKQRRHSLDARQR